MSPRRSPSNVRSARARAATTQATTFAEGDSGPAVEALQRALVALGYALPRWGADGVVGDETLFAAWSFARDRGLVTSEEVGRFALGARVVQAILEAKPASARPLPASFLDYRGRGAQPFAYRSWKAITGITLHQTATVFLDPAPGAEVARAALDKVALRVAGIQTHHTILRTGHSVWGVDYTGQVAHAQRVFNQSDVGIEIDGHYEGILGDLSTYWRPASAPGRMPLALRQVQVDAALATIAFIVATVADNGGAVRYLHAHRQTAASRIADPGSEIWQRVALPAMEAHDLSDGGDAFYVPRAIADRPVEAIYSNDGPGYPIPAAWDPRRTGAYRRRPKLPSAPDRG